MLHKSIQIIIVIKMNVNTTLMA